jgi:hypothetical protein
VEDAVVAANARSNLFIDAHVFGTPVSRLNVLCCPMELPVLCQVTGRQELDLIDHLRIGNIRTMRLIVAFMIRVVPPSSIRSRYGALRRTDIKITEWVPIAEIHSSLEARCFAPAHLDIRNDVICHGRRRPEFLASAKRSTGSNRKPPG